MKMVRSWVGLVFLFSIVLTTVAHAQGTWHRRQLFKTFLWAEEDNEYATIKNIKGKFTERGWQSLYSGSNGSRLLVTMKDRMPQSGTLEWTLKNYNPAEQADGETHHLFFMSSTDDDNDRYYNDGSWIFLRTGTGYVNSDGSASMKIDIGAKGVDTREEKYLFENKVWDVDETYWFKIIYDNYYVWIYFMDELLVKMDFPGQVKRFNQISFAGDHDYPSIAGPIFSDFSISTYDNTMHYIDKTVTKNALGLDAPNYGGQGVSVADVNNDGLEDIYVSNCIGSECIRDVLYIHKADGTFLDETIQRGISDGCCSYGAAFFDADNDGDLDFVNAASKKPIKLYINDGNGHFSEEGQARGIENMDGNTHSIIAFDVNNDGYIDIFGANWGEQNEMYINNGNGTFTREYRGAEGVVEDVETIGTQGSTVGDIDGDGDYDIYICKRDAPNELYLNENGSFRNVASERGVAIGGRSDGATFGDFDRDGDMDLFVSNSRTPGSLEKMFMYILVNDGKGFFDDQTLAYSLSMEGYTPLLFDANNDENLDIYRLRNNDYDYSSVSILSLGDGEGGFQSAGYCGATIIGADARSCVSHDFDQDGDLDLYVTTKLFENVYLENRSEISDKNWIEISTIGPKGDIGGIGGKIEVFKTGKLGDPYYLRGYREIVTSQGFMSGPSNSQHFGLNNHTSCDVRVTLTDGTVIEERNVSANQRIVIAGDQSYNVLEYISGDNQTGVINQVLGQPFRVRVTDQDGAPVADKTVNFVVTQGDGSFEGSATVMTDGNGYASVYYRLGATQGQHKIEARVTGAQNSPVEFTATAQAAALTISKVSGDNQTAQVGAALPQPLVVQAGYDNGGIAANVDVTFTIVSGGGTMSGLSSKTVQTDASGRASVSWTLGIVSGQQVLQAAVAGASVDFYAEATPGAPASLANISGAGQTLTPGVPFAQPYVAKVTDLYGNPVPNHPIIFSVISGGGMVNGTTEFFVSTDQQGFARAFWTPGLYLGPTNILRASSTYQGIALGGSPVSWSYPGVDVSATNSTVTASSPIPADGSSNSTITITLRNSQNQSVGAGLTVDVTASGSGNTISIPDSITDSNGQVRAYLSSFVGETKTITARVKGLNLELSNHPTVVFQAINQTPDKIEIVSGNNQQVTVNENTQPLVVRILDTQARPMINYDVTFVLVSGEGSLNGQTTQSVKTDADGAASVVFRTGTTAGVVSKIEARAADVPNSPAVFQITCTPDEARSIVIVSGNSQQGPPNTVMPQPLAVRVQDVHSNPISNYPVQFKVNIGQCTLNGAAQITVYTDAEGIARVTATSGDQQGQVIIEAKTAFSSVTFTLMVTEGLPDPDLKLSTLTATSPILADGISASDVVVTINDKYGRPIEGAKVKITAMGDGVKLMQPDSLTNSDGKLLAKLAATVEGEKVLLASVLPQNLYIEQTATVMFERGNPVVELISGQGLTGTVGQKSVEPLVVLLKNGDNPYVGQFVRFSVQSGGGHFNGQDTVLIKTDSQGLAYADYFFGTTAGPNVVHAATPIAPDKGVTFTMMGVADQPSKLTKQSGDEQTGRINTALNQKLTVLVTDTYNNPTPNAPVTFSAIDGGSIAAPQTVMTDSIGRAQATALCGSTIGRYTFKAELANGAFVLFSATAEQSNTPPTVISYLPIENQVSFSYNDRLLFEITQVFDADSDPINYYWHINNQMVGNQAKLVLFMSPIFGDNNTLVCTISDGQDSTFVTWALNLDTRVELSSFSGEAIGKSGIMLKWSTSLERDNLGFRILRSTSKDGETHAITDKLIQPKKDGNYQFVDSEQLQPGDYFYTLESVASSGRVMQHGPITITVQAPTDFTLLQNYPNPFNPTTTLAFELPTATNVRLIIYNQKGQFVRELVDGEMTPGLHTVVWDAKDASGVQVPTGIYLYRMTAGKFSETKKLTLMK